MKIEPVIDRKCALFAYMLIAYIVIAFMPRASMSAVIIDNDGPGTSYAGGEWGYSSGANPYGGNSRTEKEPGATYTFETPLAGSYEVSLWWTYWSSRCTDAPVDIYDGDSLLATVRVNQQENAGQWNILGTYPFGNGTARVVVRSESNSCSSSADAVSFTEAVAAELEGLEIEGPADVNENMSIQYQLRAYYLGGANRLVVPLDSLVDCPDYASISPTGLLQTVDVGSDQSCRISMTYSEGEITETATFDITIKDIVSSAESIIDNDTAGTSYAGGEWGYSSGVNPYGGSSRAEKEPGAAYTYETSLTGSYEVSLWWTYWSSRCTDVPVDIYDGNSLLATVRVDQQVNAGKWNILGGYPFSSGTARVVVRSESNTCSSSADAVRFISGTATMVEVPDFEGLEQSVAEADIRTAGLTVGAVTRQFHETVPVDHVISQNPLAETLAAQGTAVALVIASDVIDQVSVPEVTGLSRVQAEAAIVAAGLVVGSVTQGYSATVPAGAVISTEPYVGTLIDIGSAVNMVTKLPPVGAGILRHKWTTRLPGGGQIMPVMGDIDNDGDQEIVMNAGNRIVAVNGKTGVIEWSISGSANTSIELADLNRDGVPEVLYGMDGPRLRALNGNGSIRWTSAVLKGEGQARFPILSYDIDGDGYPTIWFASEDGHPDPFNGNIDDYNGALIMLDHTGKVLTDTWIHHPCWGGMSLADTDLDGRYEIYLSDRRDGYHDFPANGLQAFDALTLDPIWARPDIQHSSPMAVIADVDKDGDLDVIATKITRAGPMILDPATGETIVDYSRERLPTHGTPTVYDIDEDGNLEYIVSASYPSNAPQNFVVFDLTTGAVDFTATFNFWIAWAPSVGDVTGDGHMEILVASGNQEEEVGDALEGNYPLLVYDKNFKLISWVEIKGAGQLTPARVYDTDGDGYNEVVVAGANGMLMVYDTDARTPNPAPRTWVQNYSEYRRGAAEYVHPPLPPLP